MATRPRRQVRVALNSSIFDACVMLHGRAGILTRWFQINQHFGHLEAATPFSRANSLWLPELVSTYYMFKLKRCRLENGEPQKTYALNDNSSMVLARSPATSAAESLPPLRNKISISSHSLRLLPSVPSN